MKATILLLLAFDLFASAPVFGEEGLFPIVKQNLQNLQSGFTKNIQEFKKGIDNGISQLDKNLQQAGKQVQTNVHKLQIGSQNAVQGLQKGVQQFFLDHLQSTFPPPRVHTITIPAKVVDPVKVPKLATDLEAQVQQHIMNAVLFGDAASQATNQADRDAFNYLKWVQVKKALDAKQAAGKSFP